MKKLLVCILISMSTLLYGQDYPSMAVDSVGVKIVILTETQAQKLDSLTDMTSVCDLYKTKIELQNQESIILVNSDSLCSSIISNKDSIITIKDNIITDKDSIITIKDDKIDNLKKQKDNLIVKNDKSETTSKNKDLIIEEKDKTIKKWKFRTIGSWIIMAVVTVLLVK